MTSPPSTAWQDYGRRLVGTVHAPVVASIPPEHVPSRLWVGAALEAAIRAHCPELATKPDLHILVLSIGTQDMDLLDGGRWWQMGMPLLGRETYPRITFLVEDDEPAYRKPSQWASLLNPIPAPQLVDVDDWEDRLDLVEALQPDIIVWPFPETFGSPTRHEDTVDIADLVGSGVPVIGWCFTAFESSLMSAYCAAAAVGTMAFVESPRYLEAPLPSGADSFMGRYLFRLSPIAALPSYEDMETIGLFADLLAMSTESGMPVHLAGERVTSPRGEQILFGIRAFGLNLSTGEVVRVTEIDADGLAYEGTGAWIEGVDEMPFDRVPPLEAVMYLEAMLQTARGQG